MTKFFALFFSHCRRQHELYTQCLNFIYIWGTTAAAPLPFRTGKPALSGSRPLVAPYYCKLWDLLCLFCVYPFCVLFSVHMCILLFSLFDLSFVAFPSVLWYCWLGLLTCKNRLPYNLYCVGGDKTLHNTIQYNLTLYIFLNAHTLPLTFIWKW